MFFKHTAKGILSGYDDGTFHEMTAYLTRAEASSVLVRLIDKSERRPNADETLYDYFRKKSYIGQSH